MQVVKRDGSNEEVSKLKIKQSIIRASKDLKDINVDLITNEAYNSVFENINTKDVDKAAILAARSMIAEEPNYSYVAARLLLYGLYREVFGKKVDGRSLDKDYREAFRKNLIDMVQALRIDFNLVASFDLDKISEALVPERDLLFKYLGIQTLFDRYLIHVTGRRMETPQAFWMRVSMGLCVNESNPTEKAIETYELLSTLKYCHGTPTLFNSGTLCPQLSSCYLSTMEDSIDGIFGTVHGQARLSKYAGGLGIDITPLRGTNAYIKGTNGNSNGYIPWAKQINTMVNGVNQCLSPETLIYTNNGIKEIQNITLKDLVLTSVGEYRPIKEIMSYQQKEKMLSINIKHSVNPLEITDGHPIFSIKGIRKKQTIERSLSQINSGKFKADWVEAKDLSVRDYIGQVIPTEVFNPNNLSEEDGFVYGLFLGDGHFCKNRNECGIAFNPKTEYDIVEKIRKYLNYKNIHFWETIRGDTSLVIRWTCSDKIPFCRNDLYNNKDEKSIGPKFLNLPKNIALQVILGVISSDGNISKGKEITVCNTSLELIEGIRYQLLRFGIASAASKRNRKYNHIGQRSDGSLIYFNHKNINYDLRIPAFKELARELHIPELTKFNWLNYNGFVFSRIKNIVDIKKNPEYVYDLKIDGSSDYMTTSCLIHNGGKRKGAAAIYSEPWHIDFESFLDLLKNTGDERLRCHDLHTAGWFPDEFFKRVENNDDWYLFCPSECPDLHELYGEEFEHRYAGYIQLAEIGMLKNFKVLKAKDLWKKTLSSIKETGHPWVCFKDTSNTRYANKHCGIVHNSNLCTEIIEHTKATKYDTKTSDIIELGETAVCNIASVNLSEHVIDGKIDWQSLEKTVKHAFRMLDNVIDINYYPIAEASNSNLKNRPVGLGLMGWHDTLHKMKIVFDSDKALELAGEIQEFISYYAILSSAELAKERGKYPNYEGSLWSQNILPPDTWHQLPIINSCDKHKRVDWLEVRKTIKENGMRNSLTQAIAPTVTISSICGCSKSIEPDPSVLFVNSTLSGEFTIFNEFFVTEMKELGLWNKELIDLIKANDGNISKLKTIPLNIRRRFKRSFDIDQMKAIDITSERQKWIDQGISFNIYYNGNSMKEISDLYFYTYKKELKTTYYLHSESVSKVEKSVQSDEGKVCTLKEGCESCG